MQLTLYTDYSLRVLLYLGLNTRRVATITDIAESYGISRNHLVKVVHNLVAEGFIKSVRGRGGGLALAQSPDKINIGNMVRHTEVTFDLVECFDLKSNTCPIAVACFLKNALYEAQQAFMGVLDHYTLEDVLANRDWLRSVLKVPSPDEED